MNPEVEQKIRELARAAARYDLANPDGEGEGFRAGVKAILHAYDNQEKADLSTASIPCSKCGLSMRPIEETDDCNDTRQHSHWRCGQCSRTVLLVVRAPVKVPSQLTLCAVCNRVIETGERVVVSDDGILHEQCEGVDNVDF